MPRRNSVCLGVCFGGPSSAQFDFPLSLCCTVLRSISHLLAPLIFSTSGSPGSEGQGQDLQSRRLSGGTYSSPLWAKSSRGAERFPEVRKETHFPACIRGRREAKLFTSVAYVAFLAGLLGEESSQVLLALFYGVVVVLGV